MGLSTATNLQALLAAAAAAEGIRPPADPTQPIPGVDFPLPVTAPVPPVTDKIDLVDYEVYVDVTYSSGNPAVGAEVDVEVQQPGTGAKGTYKADSTFVLRGKMLPTDRPRVSALLNL